MNKNLIEKARQTNLLNYLSCKGYNFRIEGNRYRCKEHSSLVISLNPYTNTYSSYYWNSKDETGNSLDFIIKNLNMNFKTAVEELTNAEFNTTIEHKKSPLEPPTHKGQYIASKNHLNRAYAYLNKRRLLSTTIITNLIDKGYLKMITGPQYKYPLIGFTIKDINKKTLGYELQGTLDKVRFKGLTSDVINTDFGFNIIIGKPKNIIFFESTIDLLSYYQLAKDKTISEPFKDIILASMAGLKVNTILKMIQAFKIDSKPYISIDSDKAGIKFKKSLHTKNIAFQEINLPISNGDIKDYNDYLKYRHNL